MLGPKTIFLFLSLMMLSITLWSQEKPCPIGPNQTWSLRAELPEETSEMGAATLDGLIFTAGGYLPENHNSLLIYDIKTNRWARGPDLPKGTHHAAVVCVNNKLYVIGGMMAENAVQSTPYLPEYFQLPQLDGFFHLLPRSYDPLKDSWQTRAALPSASEHVSAAVLNGRIHVVGGRNNFRNMNLNQIYNPNTNTWSTGAGMSRDRSGMGVVAFEKRLYVFGGEDLISRVVVDSVERYDPDTNTWEVLNPMIHDVHGNPSVVFQRFIYVLGGGEEAGSGVGTNFLQRLDISNSPKQPKAPSATAISSSSIRLKWQDQTNNEDSYSIQRKNNNSFQTIGTAKANANQFDVKSLTPGTSYSFRVVAENGCGTSAPSNIASAVTKP